MLAANHSKVGVGVVDEANATIIIGPTSKMTYFCFLSSFFVPNSDFLVGSFFFERGIF